MCGGGGGGGDGGAAQREAERQARIRAGMGRINEQFEPFDDAFYDQQREAYVDYAMPQVEDDYGEAQRQQAFALARQGLTHSGTAAKYSGDLNRDRKLAVGDVLSRAESRAKQAQADVEQERAMLVNQLNATADPEQAALAAQNQANILSQGSEMQALEPLFTNATAGLALAAQPKWTWDGGQYVNKGGLANLFSDPQDRSRVVR